MYHRPTAARVMALCLAAPLQAASGQTAPAGAASSQQAQQLARRLASEPPRTVVQSYGERFEAAVLSHLDRGEPDWIALAPELARGTDAGSSEGLSMALAYALPLQPAAVLAVLRKDRGPLEAQRVCSIPFIEASVKDIKTYRHRAVQAVRQVQDPDLRPARDRCLQALQS